MGYVKLPPLIIKNFPGGYGRAIVEPVIEGMLSTSRYGMDLEGNFHNIDHPVWSHNFDYCDKQEEWFHMKEIIQSVVSRAYYTGRTVHVYGIRYTLSDEEGRMLYRHSRGDDKSEADKMQEAYNNETPIIDFNDLDMTEDELWKIWGAPSAHKRQHMP